MTKTIEKELAKASIEYLETVKRIIKKADETTIQNLVTDQEPDIFEENTVNYIDVTGLTLRFIRKPRDRAKRAFLRSIRESVKDLRRI